MKDMLGKLLKGLVEEKQTRIGKVDQALAQELKANKERHDALHAEIEAKVEAYIEQLKAEHDPICDQLKAEKAEIWEKIYDQLDLTQAERDANHRINHVTGIVHRVDIEPAFDIDGDDTDVEKPIH